MNPMNPKEYLTISSRSNEKLNFDGYSYNFNSNKTKRNTGDAVNEAVKVEFTQL